MAKSKRKSTSSQTEQPPAQFMESLKTFVRTEGATFLQDRNITSVGIGYKQKGGKSTGQISIQFTVGKKAAPEALEALDTHPIPKSFTIDGVEVPTDVLQRSYEPSYKIVTERLASPRKIRIDPIVPGVSVANHHETAGTIACIVYDHRTGTPYILSNWHVLHGPSGAIGDNVVQPGPHDDNRIDHNRLGKLVRSHLGMAGDCAVATIEERTFKSDILELNVQIDQLGEAELGDKVVKSGRTTGVTHGVVTRIHTIALIDYGGTVGKQPIGGFEIEPDPAKLPANGEISMGGDSGSAWLFKSNNGQPTRTMAGLHFAGESDSEQSEFAMACYPRSVFEKLEISLKPPATGSDNAQATTTAGYDSEFLGQLVSLPTLTEQGKSNAFKRNGSEIIPYTHFSLALHQNRRFAMWIAWNINGGQLRKISRKGIPFTLDPNIPSQFQVGDFLYAGNRLDRGHIARRADLCWGGDKEARQANRDAFFFTNITPQMDDFNQSGQGGIWGQLEDAVFAEVDVENLRLTVFGGPIFFEDDREFRGVKLPRAFYKVLAYMETGKLKAKAFLLTQSLEQLEVLALDNFRVFQVTLTEVEERTDIRFSENLKTADGFAESLKIQLEAISQRKPLESLADIRW